MMITRIAYVALGLVLVCCKGESPTSPKAMAGVYELRTVLVDAGRGNLEGHGEDLPVEDAPVSGAITLHADRSYFLTAQYGGIAGGTWRLEGEFFVKGFGGTLEFTTEGRTFEGRLSNERRQISVTEPFNSAMVRLIFEKVETPGNPPTSAPD